VDDVVCAIRPGTDVRRYARLLARTHDAMFSGGPPPIDPRRLVARPWQRVRAQGVDPDRCEPPRHLDASQVEQRRLTSPLYQVLPELRAALTTVAEDARHGVVVADANGVLLWREGSTQVRHRAVQHAPSGGSRVPPASGRRICTATLQPRYPAALLQSSSPAPPTGGLPR
jgi:hypothetical protein